MADVAYRLLVVEAGAPHGDRTVIGLVHSDGRSVRYQFHPDRLPTRWAPAGDAILGAVRTFERRLGETASSGQLHLAMELDDVLPVREGSGSALAWSPIRHASPTRAEDHFHALVREYELTPEDEAASLRVSAEELREGLRSLGEQLRSVHGSERVRVGSPSEGDLSFTPPVSWKNGRWHHAIGVSLDYRKPSEVTRRMLEISGVALLGVPEGEVPVLVAVMPASPDARVEAENGRLAIAKHREDVQLIEADRDADRRFAVLLARIEADLAARH